MHWHQTNPLSAETQFTQCNSHPLTAHDSAVSAHLSPLVPERLLVPRGNPVPISSLPDASHYQPQSGMRSERVTPQTEGQGLCSQVGGPGGWGPHVEAHGVQGLGVVLEMGGGCLAATSRPGGELFTFFVAGVRDKDILVGKSKIVGLGV